MVNLAQMLTDVGMDPELVASAETAPGTDTAAEPIQDTAADTVRETVSADQGTVSETGQGTVVEMGAVA